MCVFFSHSMYACKLSARRAASCSPADISLERAASSACCLAHSTTCSSSAHILACRAPLATSTPPPFAIAIATAAALGSPMGEHAWADMSAAGRRTGFGRAIGRQPTGACTTRDGVPNLAVVAAGRPPSGWSPRVVSLRNTTRDVPCSNAPAAVTAAPHTMSPACRASPEMGFTPPLLKATTGDSQQ